MLSSHRTLLNVLVALGVVRTAQAAALPKLDKRSCAVRNPGPDSNENALTCTMPAASTYDASGAIGSCGVPLAEMPEYVVAVGEPEGKCGQQLQLTNPSHGNTITATIVDTCVRCKGGGDNNVVIDLNAAAFKALYGANADMAVYDIQGFDPYGMGGGSGGSAGGSTGSSGDGTSGGAAISGVGGGAGASPSNTVSSTPGDGAAGGSGGVVPTPQASDAGAAAGAAVPTSASEVATSPANPGVETAPSPVVESTPVVEPVPSVASSAVVEGATGANVQPTAPLVGTTSWQGGWGVPSRGGRSGIGSNALAGVGASDGAAVSEPSRKACSRSLSRR